MIGRCYTIDAEGLGADRFIETFSGSSISEIALQMLCPEFCRTIYDMQGTWTVVNLLTELSAWIKSIHERFLRIKITRITDREVYEAEQGAQFGMAFSVE